MWYYTKCWYNEKENILVKSALTVIETKEENQKKEEKIKDPSSVSLGARVQAH